MTIRRRRPAGSIKDLIAVFFFRRDFVRNIARRRIRRTLWWAAQQTAQLSFDLGSAEMGFNAGIALSNEPLSNFVQRFRFLCDLERSLNDTNTLHRYTP